MCPHELRTPLNSVLILAQSLAENSNGNLERKQIECAETIYSSGSDLLSLINEILDLAKIESGTMAIEVSDIRFKDIADYIERNFSHVAKEKKLAFEVSVDKDLPGNIITDEKRLYQVLRNLLSNAIKFTEKGKVATHISFAREGWSFDNDILNNSEKVVAVAVRDTGIGIPDDKRNLIFEAFQQVEGGASRKYGGTGLGLSISREIARLLGGEIRLNSKEGKEVPSRFTSLCVTQCHTGWRALRRKYRRCARLITLLLTPRARLLRLDQLLTLMVLFLTLIQLLTLMALFLTLRALLLTLMTLLLALMTLLSNYSIQVRL